VGIYIFQTYSTWVLQANLMDRYVALGNFYITPDQTQIFNPLFNIIIIPIMNKLVYPMFEKCKCPLKYLQRMFIGMLLTSASFVVAGILQLKIANNPSQSNIPEGISIFWQMPQYFLISLGEVLLSVSGLQFAYSESPTTTKSALAAIWYLTAGLGNILVVMVSRVTILPHGEDVPLENDAYNFFFYAGLMFVFALIFVFLAYGYKYKRDEKQSALTIN